MRIPRLIIPFAVLLFAIASAPDSKSAAPQPMPVPDGWRLLSLPGKPATRFTAAPDGAITVAAKDSVGFLYCSASEMPGSGRYLTWRWRVDAAPPSTDLSMRGMDDRPLAVHVWFQDETRSGSGWDLKTRLGAWLFNYPLPGKTLAYVWGGTSKRGDSLRNPYQALAGHIVVLRPGSSPSMQWFAETVDVAADFEAAFGYRPGAPTYIAISADTDDKGGTSTGVIAGLSFTNKR